jgi:hypothetical protein
MDRCVKSGIFGFSLMVIINIFSPIDLDFIPSFVAAILAIYVFRLGEFRDGLVVAFMTYIFGRGFWAPSIWQYYISRMNLIHHLMLTFGLCFLL